MPNATAIDCMTAAGARRRQPATGDASTPPGMLLIVTSAAQAASVLLRQGYYPELTGCRREIGQAIERETASMWGVFMEEWDAARRDGLHVGWMSEIVNAQVATVARNALEQTRAAKRG